MNLDLEGALGKRFAAYRDRDFELSGSLWCILARVSAILVIVKFESQVDRSRLCLANLHLETVAARRTPDAVLVGRSDSELRFLLNDGRLQAKSRRLRLIGSSNDSSDPKLIAPCACNAERIDRTSTKAVLERRIAYYGEVEGLLIDGGP